MTDDRDAELRRLQREVLALASVNRQLQADLEGRGLLAVAAPRDRLATPAPVGAPVSAGLGPFRSAITQVRGGTEAGSDPVAVVESGGATYLLEGLAARPVTSSVVVAMLEELVGPRTTLGAEDLAMYADGDPVSVMQGPAGPPFLALGGRKVSVRGWPTIQKVAVEVAEELDDGGELNLARLVAAKRGAVEPADAGVGPSTAPSDRVRELARRARRAASRLGK